MSVTLYELTGNYNALYGKLSSGEELTEEEFDALMKLDGDIKEKLEGYGRIINELESDSERLDAEIKRLQNRKKSIDNGLSRIYTRLENTMILHGMASEPIKTERFTFKFRKSSAVEVSDKFIEWAREYHRDDLLNYAMPKPNLTAIKEALEKGQEIPAFIKDKKTLKVG